MVHPPLPQVVELEVELLDELEEVHVAGVDELSTVLGYLAVGPSS